MIEKIIDNNKTWNLFQKPSEVLINVKMFSTVTYLSFLELCWKKEDKKRW